MKKLMIVFSLILIAVIGVSLFMYDMGIDNKEMAMRERFKGQYKVTKTSHDNMFKVITQGAQVTDKYGKDFDKIFGKIAGDLMDDNAMIQLVSGFNPNLSPDLYKNLLSTIKTERAKFKRAQDICIDVSREYATYIKTKPQTWFINDEILEARELIKNNYEKDLVTESKNFEPETKEAFEILMYEPVTSSTTKDVFKTGVDDNIDLFTEDKKEEDKANNTEDNKELTDEQKAAKTAEAEKLLKEHPEVAIAVGSKIK